MKTINKKTSTKKIILITLIAVLLAFAGTASAYYAYRLNSPSSSPLNTQPDNENNTKGSADNQPASDSGDKEEFLDNESDPSTPSSTPSFNSENIELSIEQNDSTITISTKLTGFSGAGNCELKLSRGSALTTESAEIIYQPEYSTCAGFSVERKRLSTGTWTVNLAVKTESQTFNQSGEFTIK